MKTIAIAACLSTALAAMPAVAGNSLSVPESMVTPATVKHTHRTVVKKHTTRKVVRHHRTTTTTASNAVSNNAGATTQK